MKKPRSDAKLFHLPEEQQAQIAEWLLSGMSLHATRELAIKNFGVTASLSGYSRFYTAVCVPELLARRRRAVMTSEEVAAEAQKNVGQFDVATMDALKQRAFELAISPTCDSEDLKALCSLILKSRDQERERDRLQLNREKFEHLKAQSENSKAVISSPSLTPEEKEAGMKRILGIV